MELLFRKVRPLDKPAVMDLTRTIWEGHDYLPRVFDEWVADPSGHFYAAESDGRLVGLGRASFPDPGEAWLEGGRIHPDYRGKGLASVLFAYQMYVVRQFHARVVRFATDSENAPVQHLAQVHDFHRLTDSSLWEAEPGGRFLAEIVPSSLFEPIWEQLQDSLWGSITGGLLCQGWVWKSLTPERLRDNLEAGLVWAWPDVNSRRGLLIAGQNHEYGSATCGWITGDREACCALAESLRAWAVGWSTEVEAVIPLNLVDIVYAFQDAGFSRWEYAVQSLFERCF